MTPTLWDMHVHLDFMRNRMVVAAEAAALDLGMLAVTVTPQGYRQLRQELAGAGNVCVAAGLHPWWVADGRCTESDVAQAAKLVRQTRFVGEIGLDLSPKHVPGGSLEAQLFAFKALAQAAAETSEPTSPKVLSLHSVRAAGLTLDVLEQAGTLGLCRNIFHWFTGTSDELHRAAKAGCFFSVNEMMLRTRRGREYARQLPADRLLLETDLPPGEDVSFPASEVHAALMRTATQLAAIRTTTADEIARITCANSQKLLDL